MFFPVVLVKVRCGNRLGNLTRLGKISQQGRNTINNDSPNETLSPDFYEIPTGNLYFSTLLTPMTIQAGGASAPDMVFRERLDSPGIMAHQAISASL